MMDASGLLLVIFAVMSTSECSETAEPQCNDSDQYPFYLLEGEAFYFVHLNLPKRNYSNEEVTWHRNNSRIENIYDENERIHCHGGALFFLNLLIEDSGFYTARLIDQSGKCKNYNVKIEVFEASRRGSTPLLWGSIDTSSTNKRIPCPHPVEDTCEMFGGNYTWYKDFNLLQGNHEDNLRIDSATKQHEGIYTCICTWTHNNKVYNSSGSRELIFKEQAAYLEVEILSPTNKEQFADEGFQIKLNCSVFCGINVKTVCDATWLINGVQVNQMDGYNQTTYGIMEEPSKKTISTAILTIETVSAKDFQAEFKCAGKGLYTTNYATLSLKKRASMIRMVIAAVSVLFICVFVALLVKCFAIDLALLLRPYLPLRSHREDTRSYDAYVVYETQSMDVVAEETLCRFVTQTLPSVLEEKCGYRLFIHGRDDIPGEDRVALVEDSMTQSRRLLVILTLGSGSEVADQHPSLHDSVTGGFDWQVGLHHALVQREMSVILIQLGETGPQGYKHLPIGLQHLIRKSAPLRWPESSRDAAACNSRFWKRVRYLMPAVPAKKCQKASVI
ncbi:interleukin-1 receptor-like 1 isoform X2 [Scophthalmus maximus]|nr:interleukin-1 receptor-like 1 isoform X2 [Scophthalmus maximus]XP_035460566.2 interleukin-1 receptor-like 1 isoform X2 [Scophthalmus maximus]XP_035460567.2 interleukin-1 receptor-like 1 isoform X2 [Scophthalmus maximus]XP_035460568.2 interleukin-1 receptor-like 1 isoform X2 [Scophthalmus maximus]XP_035460569.2 interleukin-1 receptor-like 1 isoform X2 [Scophthalmus maximus]XP_035460570.2 interleukin-1 receptor-like 1 isoform X2 [Scophthalmus maximus]